MAVVGVGIDLCSIARWEAMLQRRPGLLQRILNPAEAATSTASQAARWAAKEALAKAIGAPAGMAWLDSEVVRTESGAPRFEVRGSVAARVAELGITTIHLSMSHDGGMATAIVICEDA
ncbi:holo-ACP synthase [Luteococcus peritonei]|uniref:Holo-[acyl-carrier-protein] synthase n=1 Tax=Luteococcus peritonei TaxID=88874 RepID=A0ABW4RTE0_9ACTN